MPTIRYDISKASKLGVNDLPQIVIMELGFDSIDYRQYENIAYIEVYEIVKPLPEYITEIK